MITPNNIDISPNKCVGCYICRLACSFKFFEEFNIFSARIDVNWILDKTEITFTNECTDCGTCADYCMYGCLTRKIKLEVF